VNATSARAPTVAPVAAAALVIAAPMVVGRRGSRGGVPSASALTWRMMRSLVATAAVACNPTLVSPESITASAPSRTALATSEVSARVGRGADTMDSRIWVATMTGLDRSRAIVIALLHQGHLLERHFHSEIPAGHHEAVEGVEDLGQPAHRLWLLQLGHHRRPAALLVLPRHRRDTERHATNRSHRTRVAGAVPKCRVGS